MQKNDMKEVQSKKNENKDSPCSRKKYSTREKYVLENIVELG